MTREEAIEMLTCELRIWEADCKSKHPTKDALYMAIEALKNRPTGHWIEHEWAEERDGFLTSDYECSNCHDWLPINPDYCPSCGAYMRGEKE